MLDRGFIFGDGVYEVSRSIPPPVPPDRALAAAAEQPRCDAYREPADRRRMDAPDRRVVARNAGEDQSIYLQVTRGVAKRDHGFPKDAKPTVFMMSSPLVTPAAEKVEHGVSCGDRAPTIAGCECDVKSMSLLGELPAAAARGRRRRGRGGAVPRRLSDRRLGSRTFRRQERHAARAPEESSRAPGHHLRRRAGARRGNPVAGGGARDPGGGSAQRGRAVAHLVTRRCWRSARSTASRSAPAGRERCSGRSTANSRNSSARSCGAAA